MLPGTLSSGRGDGLQADVRQKVVCSRRKRMNLEVVTPGFKFWSNHLLVLEKLLPAP
jgi:hypothetical protein